MIVLPAAVLAGCASEPPVSSDRLRIETMETAMPARAPAPDGPSLRPNDLSRSHWAEQAYLLPIDGTRRLPELAGRIRLTDETGRQRGEFPDQRTALDVASDRSLSDAAAEGLVWPFFAVADLVWIAPKAFARDLFEDPDEATGRVDRRPAALARAGFLPPYGLPAVVPVPPAVLSAGQGPAQDDVPPGAWFFRDGRWYQGTQGLTLPPEAKIGELMLIDGRWLRVPEPAPPPRQTPAPATPRAASVDGSGSTPAPPPAGAALDLDALPEGSWIFRDGQWLQGRKPRGPR